MNRLQSDAGAVVSFLFAAVISTVIGSAPGSALAAGDVVTEVVVLGAANGASIRETLSTRPRSPLSDSAVAADIRRLWRLGVFDDVRVDLARSTRGATVTFTVVPRPRLSRVWTAGNSAMSDAELRAALALPDGAAVSASALLRARERIRAAYAARGYLLASVELARAPASPGATDLLIRVDEQRAVEVRHVSFVGNRALDDRTLKAASTITSGELFPLVRSEARTRALETERQRIARRYLEAGYAEVDVATPRIHLSADRRALFVTIPITEGVRYQLGHLELPEGIAVDDARLALSPGEHYDHGRVESAAETIRWILEERGHAFATVVPVPRPDPATRVVDVGFRVDTGPRAIVEDVRIRGNDRTRDAVIRRRLAVAPGDRYTATGVSVSSKRVQALGFFETVTPSVIQGSAADKVIVTFEVRERPTGTFMVGAGFSTIESFIASASIRQANLFGRGHSLELASQVSARRTAATIAFHNPHIGGSDWSGGAEAYTRHLEWPGFSRDATGGAVTLGRPLSERTSASLTYRLEQVSSEASTSSDVFARLSSGALPVGLFGAGLTSSLRATLAYDGRDDRLRPATGTSAGVFAELASRWLGSENTFTRYGAWVHHHQPLGGAGLHLRGDVGLITSLDAHGVPLAERFQAGGIHDIRGYAPGGLGPRLRIGGAGPGETLGELSLGGNFRLTASAELVVPLVSSLGISGLVFFDIGNVFNLERRYCRAAISDGADVCPGIRDATALLAGLRASVGAGFRWQSPLGQLRFEWGVPLVRRPGDPRVRFHFGIL